MNKSYLHRLKLAARSKHRSEQRKVEFPAGQGVIPKDFIRMEPWEIEYLYMVALNVKHGILETGRFKGGSTLTFAHATSKPIFSIDIGPQDDNVLNSLLDQCKLSHNVNLIVGDSQHSKYDQVGSYDLLFVDGDHSFQGCLNDLNNWWDNLVVGGHVLCHDCYMGNEVQQAVIEFIKDKNVRVFLSPYIQSQHWLLPHGSLCHFQKVE